MLNPQWVKEEEVKSGVKGGGDRSKDKGVSRVGLSDLSSRGEILREVLSCPVCRKSEVQCAIHHNQRLTEVLRRC